MLKSESARAEFERHLPIYWKIYTIQRKRHCSPVMTRKYSNRALGTQIWKDTRRAQRYGSCVPTADLRWGEERKIHPADMRFLRLVLFPCLRTDLPQFAVELLAIAWFILTEIFICELLVLNMNSISKCRVEARCWSRCLGFEPPRQSFRSEVPTSTSLHTCTGLVQR